MTDHPTPWRVMQAVMLEDLVSAGFQVEFHDYKTVLLEPNPRTKDDYKVYIEGDTMFENTLAAWHALHDSKEAT